METLCQNLKTWPYRITSGLEAYRAVFFGEANTQFEAEN